MSRRIYTRDRRLVVGIAGRIGAGKTTAAKYLVKAHGFLYLRYSEVLSEQFDGPKTRKALQELGWRIMSEGLQRELNAGVIRRINGPGNFVIDGLRHPIDFRSLRKQFGPRFVLLYVDTPATMRFRRVRRRRHLAGLADFERIDKHPVESHIPKLRRRAMIVIPNTSTIVQLHRRIDRALADTSREAHS